jgi:hypothetical protein
VPTAVAVFARDIFPPIKPLADRTNNIVRWTEFDRGGHFAVMEQPRLLTTTSARSSAGCGERCDRASLYL